VRGDDIADTGRARGFAEDANHLGDAGAGIIGDLD
jgi:hypothetical protein